jgi:hypothetical protein
MEVRLEQFARTLLLRTHVTDDFHRGAYRERRDVACSIAEIAPDSPGWLIVLRFDVDSEGGAAAQIEGLLPVSGPVKKSAGTGISRSVGIIYGSGVER